MTIESGLTNARDVRFRATFEQGAIGIAHVDMDGRWLEANQELCRIVGYSSDELTSLTIRDLTHPDDLNADLACIHRVLADDVRAYSLRKRYVRKDGAPVWIDLTSTVVRDGAGNPSHFLKVVRPLLPPWQAELRPGGGGAPREHGTAPLLARPVHRGPDAAWLSQLPGAEVGVTRFESVAHDLNNLLFVILSYAELSMSSLSLSSRVGQDVREIERAARRAYELTRYLVTLDQR